MKKSSYEIIMTGLSGAKQITIEPGMKFMAVVNATDNELEVYQDRRTVADSSIKAMFQLIPNFTQLTIPIDKSLDFTFIWTSGAKTGPKKATVIFSDENLNMNGQLGTPGSLGSVIIGGDSVGLARSSQLPQNLTGAGRLATEVMNEVAIKTNGPLTVDVPGVVQVEGTVSLASAIQVGTVNVEPGSAPIETKDVSASLDGFAVTVGSTVASLPDRPCREVIIQADPDNTSPIRIGGATSQTFKLLPGAALSFPVNNAKLLYARTESGSQALYGIWRD